MVCKFIVLCAALAVTNAGHLVAPVAQVAHYSSAPAVSSSYISQPLAAIHGAPYAAPYAAVHAAPYAVQAAPVAAAPVAIHSPAIGASHQSVLRSLGGNQAVSTYSKAVDSAFSTVRKYDTRITNDALSVAHSPLYAQAAPVLAHSAPAAYATYAAPALAHAAPVATYSAPAPVATYAAHAPVATYAAHAPVATYAAHAPVATYAAHAPVTGYAASAPVLTKAAVSYSPATVVAHTTFTGLGAQYEW